jgi:integrase
MQLGLGRPELVFTTIEGDSIPPDRVSKAWERQVAALGMPRVRFHALRHTHASMLIAEGIDVVQISKRLGHADVTTTLNTYADLFKKDDGDLIAAIERRVK